MPRMREGGRDEVPIWARREVMLCAERAEREEGERAERTRGVKWVEPTVRTAVRSVRGGGIVERRRTGERRDVDAI